MGLNFDYFFVDNLVWPFHHEAGACVGCPHWDTVRLWPSGQHVGDLWILHQVKQPFHTLCSYCSVMMTLSSLFVDINVVILRCHHYLYINVVDLVKITVYSQPIILSILDFIYCTSTNIENFINYLNNKIHEIDIHCILMKPKCTVVLFFNYVYNIICHDFPPAFIQTHNFLCFPPIISDTQLFMFSSIISDTLTWQRTGSWWCMTCVWWGPWPPYRSSLTPCSWGSYIPPPTKWSSLLRFVLNFASICRDFICIRIDLSWLRPN